MSNCSILSDMLLGNKKGVITTLIALIALIIPIIRIFHSRRNERNKRIAEVVNNFKSQLKNGYFLEILIPSGISNLKNDKEIEIALSNIKNNIGRHPIKEKWNKPIKEIGYKKFFLAVSNSGKTLDKYSIENFINQFEKHKTNK